MLFDGSEQPVDNALDAQALYFMYYNFARVNQAVRMSPAMAAGIETRLWDFEDIVDLIDATAETRGAADDSAERKLRRLLQAY